MASSVQVTVLDRSLVTPPPSTVSELSLPLTFSDMIWLAFTPPVQRLVFYELPISKSDYVDTIVPKLKESLSLALKHFPALAGNLIVPQDSSKPEIRYVNGDSVPLILAETSFGDFDHLVSNQARNCNEFYPLVPFLPHSSKSSPYTKLPLLALQVTLFPEIGICIGISNQHVAGDGTTMFSFMKAWTAIYQLGEDAILSPPGNEYLPSYDRDVMSQTKELDEFVWKFVREGLDSGKMVIDQPQSLLDDTDKVRATFVVRPGDVQKLKNYVSNHKSSIKHLSTFTAVCGYVWNCMAKSSIASTETVDEEKIKYFVFVADCRGRSDPKIPANYFGNCLVFCMVSAKSKELTGEGGFPLAAELIGEAIQKRFQKKEGPFEGLEKMISDFAEIDITEIASVAGSPRQSYYNMDFGWGKPRKYEFVSIDLTGALSFSGSRDSGSLEIGLSMPKKKLEAFATIFTEGLKTM